MLQLVLRHQRASTVRGPQHAHALGGGGSGSTLKALGHDIRPSLIVTILG